MHFYVDNTVESEYDINKQWTETTYDGEPDSWVVAVPGHWHKVSQLFPIFSVLRL